MREPEPEISLEVWQAGTNFWPAEVPFAGRDVFLSIREAERLVEVAEFLKAYGNTVMASWVMAVVRKYESPT